MFETALSDAEEFRKVYGLFAIYIPTKLPFAEWDYSDSTFETRNAANNVVVQQVINGGGGNEDNQLCLIGTTLVIKS